MKDNDSELHITEIDQSDDANYSCSVGTNDVRSNFVHLKVKGINFN